MPPPPPPPSAPPAAPNPYAPPGLYVPPPPGAWGQPAVYAAPRYPRTNGLAIASLVLGIVGWIPCGIGSVVAIVLGFVARAQMRNSQAGETGDGMARAGIILGFAGIGLWVAYFVVYAIVTSHNGTGTSS